MWEEIFKWLTEKAPILGLLVVAIAATIYLTNKFHFWVGKIKKSEEDCKKIDGHIVPQLSTINTSVNNLNSSFKGLLIHLQAKEVLTDTNLFMSRSPIRLTPLGWILLDAIGGRKYIDENIDLLINEMNNIGVKTALDSQTIAPLVITKLSANDNFNPIKDYVYNHPLFHTTDVNKNDITITLDLNRVANVMGIYLRDKYLERNAHLNPEDIPTITS